MLISTEAGDFRDRPECEMLVEIGWKRISGQKTNIVLDLQKKYCDLA